MVVLEKKVKKEEKVKRGENPTKEEQKKIKRVEALKKF